MLGLNTLLEARNFSSLCSTCRTVQVDRGRDSIWSGQLNGNGKWSRSYIAPTLSEYSKRFFCVSVFCLTFIYNHNLNVRVCHRGRDLLQKIFYNNACFKWSLKPLFIFTFHVVFSFFFASVYCAGFNVTSYFLM